MPKNTPGGKAPKGRRAEDALESYYAHARRELVPKVRDSSIFISLCPDPEGGLDLKFATELGLCVWYGKPLIAVGLQGRLIPESVRRLAVEVIEGVDLQSGAGQATLQAAVERQVERSQAVPPEPAESAQLTPEEHDERTLLDYALMGDRERLAGIDRLLGKRISETEATALRGLRMMLTELRAMLDRGYAEQARRERPV